MVPSNKSILFDAKYSVELLKIAKGDLASAKALLEAKNPGRPENILYMVQQSVEKCIKSVLIKKQIAFPMVHDLGTLIALLPPDDYPPGGFNWNALNPYASIPRYEEGAIPVTKEEITASYEASILVVDWAEKF